MLLYNVQNKRSSHDRLDITGNTIITIPSATFPFLFQPVTVSTQSQTPTILGCQLVKQMNLLGPGPIFTTSFEAYYCSSTSSAATSKRLLTREAELCLQSATQRYFHCNCKGGHSLGDRQWPCRSDCVRGKSGHFSSCIKALWCAVDSSSLLSDINH